MLEYKIIIVLNIPQEMLQHIIKRMEERKKNMIPETPKPQNPKTPNVTHKRRLRKLLLIFILFKIPSKMEK